MDIQKDKNVKSQIKSTRKAEIHTHGDHEQSPRASGKTEALYWSG